MSNPTDPRREQNVQQTALGTRLRLDDLADREALSEVCRSFHALFGISIRIYTQEGQLLADAVQDQQICTYLQSLKEARHMCANTVSAVKALEPAASGDITHPCFTGAVYRVFSIEYDGRRLGRVVLGPFLPLEVREVPLTLLQADKSIDPQKAKELLPQMPRVRPDTVARIGNHLQSLLDLILFSGHKALLTSQMHLASVRESYRELQEQNARLAESYERLKELDRLKSNFLATVSHELRTPLTSILGYSEMLSAGLGGDLTAEQQDFVQTILDKGQQLLALIRSLLDQSKLESGTLSLKLGDVNLIEVIRDVHSTMIPVAKKRGVELHLNHPEDVPTIRGDAEKLRQVFVNLADNAIKFTFPGGSVRLSVHIETDSPDDEDGMVLFADAPSALIVQVSDTGIGIPESERSKIFDAFYQVDGSSTREYGGTGLGLSIVKRLVEMHGGTIRVDASQEKSTPAPAGLANRAPRTAGFGSLFTARFPLAL